MVQHNPEGIRQFSYCHRERWRSPGRELRSTGLGIHERPDAGLQALMACRAGRPDADGQIQRSERQTLCKARGSMQHRQGQ